MDVNNAGENEPGSFHRFFHLLFRMINAFFASLMHAVTDDDAGNEPFESHALIDSSAFLANNRVNRRIRDDDVSFLELDQPTEVALDNPPFGSLTKLGVDVRLMIYKYLPNEGLKLEITPPNNKWERVDENPLISLGLTCRAAFDECHPVWEASSPSTLVNLVIHENDQARGVWQSVQSVLFPGVDKMSALDGTTTREQRSLAMFLDKDHPKTNAFLPKLPLATPIARLRVQIDSFPLCFICAIANLIQSLDFGFGLNECTLVLPRRLPPGFLTYFRSLQFRPAVLEQLWLETVLCRCTIKFEVRRGWLAHYLTGRCPQSYS